MCHHRPARRPHAPARGAGEPLGWGGGTGTFAAVMDPSKGPALRDVLARLAAVLDETCDDGVI